MKFMLQSSNRVTLASDISLVLQGHLETLQSHIVLNVVGHIMDLCFTCLVN